MRRLSYEQVLRLHDALIEEFGGTAGIRDQGLLDSALNTPFATFLAAGIFTLRCRLKLHSLDSGW